MKICLGDHQWFDENGKPLVAGRVSVYLHDSDTFADIYTLENDEFVQAQNPVTLSHDGSCPSIYFEATVVDVKVEQFNGLNYELVDTYSDGFTFPKMNNESVVHGITGLADTDPSIGVVNVVGYENEQDCGTRTFVWDPSCTLNDDGGVIVASNVSDSGRWLLVSDLREMPSSYYGIKPGSDEANISAFLTYPEYLGQWQIPTPPVPRFLAGTYTTEGTFSTTKTISFDPSARFEKASFLCYAAEVTVNPTHYVADFLFVKQYEAHSGWFRSVNAFWQCGAKVLIQDNTNHFTDTDIPIGVTVANARIEGKPITVTGTGYITFDKCDIAPKSLSTDWYTKFQNVSFSDRWFADGNWNFGLTTGYKQVVNITQNVADVNNFDSGNVFTLIMAANNQTKLDLCGKTVSYIDKDWSFTEIHNAVIGEAHVAHDTYFEKVTCNAFFFEDGVSNCTLKDCIATIYESSAAQLAISYSTIAFECDVNTITTSLNVLQSNISLDSHSIGPWDGTDFTLHGTVTFKYSIVTNGSVFSNGIFLQQSQFENVQFTLYPYGASGTYAYLLAIDGNTFSGASQIAFKPNNGYYDMADCYEVDIHSFSITDNWFSTTMYGITMPFWHPDMQHRFIKGQVQDYGFDYVQSFNIFAHGYDTNWSHEFRYSGNRGNCPSEYVEYAGPTATGQGNFTVYDGTTSLRYATRTDTVPYKVFCLPVEQSDGGSTSGGSWVIGDAAKACTPYKAKYNYASEEVTADFPYVMLVPACAVDKSLTNDMFTVHVATNSTYGILQNHAIFGRKSL